MRVKRLYLIILFLFFFAGGCGSADAQTQTSDFVSDKYEFYADVNHNGKEDIIQVICGDGVEEQQKVVHLSVYENNKVLYEDDLYVHITFGSQYYLVEYDKESYLMKYAHLVDHDAVSLEYEVFSLDASGKKVLLDQGKIETSLFDVKDMDKDAWYEFADKENQYFNQASLLVSTSDGKLIYGDPQNPKNYEENFSWMLLEGMADTTDITSNLELFIQQVSEEYISIEK